MCMQSEKMAIFFSLTIKPLRSIFNRTYAMRNELRYYKPFIFLKKCLCRVHLLVMRRFIASVRKSYLIKETVSCEWFCFGVFHRLSENTPKRLNLCCGGVSSTLPEIKSYFFKPAQVPMRLGLTRLGAAGATLTGR